MPFTDSCTELVFSICANGGKSFKRQSSLLYYRSLLYYIAFTVLYVDYNISYPGVRVTLREHHTGDNAELLKQPLMRVRDQHGS